MAYNSDGYIMIDFTEVDFRRTNQTIEGLYKRCVDVIGTNKFILVINANGRTPLPATCSFTNNQYVIDTCIYMFAISSNDNLFIRRNDVPASDIIDDSSISVDKTWSSNKIDTELNGKADTSALADYQPLLTPVSPISIVNDNISVDLSNYQPMLTEGDNISIVNNVISAEVSAVIDDTMASTTKTYSSDKINGLFNGLVKSFTYVGTNTATRQITIPDDCNYILKIEGAYTKVGVFNYGTTMSGIPIINNLSLPVPVALYDNTSVSTQGSITYPIFATVNDNTLTLEASNSRYALNSTGGEFTVYYI